MTVPASAATAAKPSLIHVEWAGGHRFDAGRPNGPTVRIDGDGETGQSPPETLLTALATCVSYDVIDILAKQRTPIESAAGEMPRGFFSLTRREVGERYPGCCGRLDWPLPLNGEWSDLMASFDLVEQGGGLVVVLVALRVP